jgi:hypothetical protein
MLKPTGRDSERRGKGLKQVQTNKFSCLSIRAMPGD